jgi:hypothetical protein
MDRIKAYISVPRVEFKLFETALKEFDVCILTDQEILAANPHLILEDIEKSSGQLQQQVVKAEFWRLNFSKSYVCLDSDAKFIKPFYKTDFLYKDDLPYTVMDEAQEFLEFILTTPKKKIYDDFFYGGKLYQNIFGRLGKVYSFGPMPVIWHRNVWESLERNYLNKNNINKIDTHRDRFLGKQKLSHRIAVDDTFIIIIIIIIIKSIIIKSIIILYDYLL